MSRTRIQRGVPARGLAGLLLALTLLLAGWTTTAAAAGPRLLLLPVVVHSAEDPAYLRNGISDMLAARFDRLGAVELIRSPPGSDGTTEPERALALARKAGADFVLFGSFTRFGKGASLDVQCVPVSQLGAQREPLREIFVHSGSIGEIIPDLDELAGKVSRFARGEIVSPASPAPGGLASTSPLRDLTARVQALEAQLEELLEQGRGNARETGREAGTAGELR